MDKIAVIGAGLAGLRCAEALRDGGFGGELHIVGSEAHKPYTRPPLSKAYLTSDDVPEVALRGGPSLGATWHLGQAATHVDWSARSVRLQNGTDLEFDGLAIATGAAARPWPGTPYHCSGVHFLRHLDDAKRLRERLNEGPRRVVVVGAGFIGGEVASSARMLGHDVTIIELGSQPLVNVLGPNVGERVAAIHRENGVAVHLGVAVDSFESERGVLSGVRLSSGELIPADLCLLALGGVPATSWLAGTGLDCRGGVRCHDNLAVVGVRDVVAAGDVVRWPHRRFGGEVVNVGHWTNAAAQGIHAARTLLAREQASEPFDAIPSFWSSFHGVSIRSVGIPALGQETHQVEGSVFESSSVIAYLREKRVVGIVGIGRRVDQFAPTLGEPLEACLELVGGG